MLPYIKEIYNFFRDIFNNKNLIFELVKKELQIKYLGSYFGIIWAFIQPIFLIGVLWFVFAIGFRLSPVGNFPFILWLMSGMIPWFFFSEGLLGATDSIVENSYLIKKLVFRVSILPIIKISAALIIHLFFIVVLLVMFLLHGIKLTPYILQIFYYLFATTFLILSISWFTSSLIVFIKDIRPLVSMALQLLFWLTPIFWSATIIPAKYQIIIKLNPLYYIIAGYRDALINHKCFWVDQVHATIYFWTVTFILFFAGVFVFRKLRPHFGDVL